jgi:aerobic-type carbon monoxide dehydrogenase small subunit (CoxS/CutS family)
MEISAYRLLSKNTRPSEKDIRKAVAGSTCRCAGHQNILRAIETAAEI